MHRLLLILFIIFLLAACGGSDESNDSESEPEAPSSGRDDPGSEDGNYEETYPLENISILSKPVSSETYAGLAIYDTQGNSISLIGEPGEDDHIDDVYAIRVTDKDFSYNVYISYDGLPTHIEFQDGQVYLNNIRLDENLADLEIVLPDGNIIIEPNHSIEFLTRIIKTDSSDNIQARSYSADALAEPIPPSEAFKRLRNIIGAGFITKDFVECYLSTKVALTTGGLVAAKTAKSNCEDATKKAIDILDDGRLEITDENFISCATGDCSDVLESISLDTMNILIKRFETLEEYARWSDEAFEEIYKDPVKEDIDDSPKEPRFGGIITPTRNEIISDPEFIVEVRLDDIFSSVNYASFSIFDSVTGARIKGTDLLKDPASKTRWLELADMAGAANGEYILEIEIDHNNSRKIVHQLPFTYRYGIYELYKVSTYSPIFNNKKILIRNKTTTVFVEGENYKTRTDSNSQSPNTNFRFEMNGYLSAHHNDITTISSDGQRFPSTITVCKFNGRFLPKKITRTGNVTGYFTNKGSGTIRGEFSVNTSGEINMETSFNGTFDGSGYVDSFTVSINRSLSLNGPSKTGNYRYSSITNRTLIPYGVGGIYYEQITTSDGFSLSESELRYMPFASEPFEKINSDSIPDACL